MKRKSTDKLNKILKSNIPISQYLKENTASFHKLTLPETFEIILKENRISKAQAVKGSNLERTHGYQILSGKRNPTRDTLLRMCIGMKASSEQTRIFLLKIKAAPLYSKDKRDSVILFGILHHINLQEINELLYQNQLLFWENKMLHSQTVGAAVFCYFRLML